MATAHFISAEQAGYVDIPFCTPWSAAMRLPYPSFVAFDNGQTIRDRSTVNLRRNLSFLGHVGSLSSHRKTEVHA